MVSAFSSADREHIEAAIAEAERATGAELACVVAPVSDAYQSHVLLYGLLLGSAIDLGLWFTKTLMIFPLLLMVQFLAIALMLSLPPLRRLCVHLVPQSIRHHRAAHSAYEEYLRLSAHLPASKPIVLLYISLAEHYAHILTSRIMREGIPESQWQAVIKELIDTVPAKGIREASIHAIRHIAEVVAAEFPITPSPSHNYQAHPQSA